MMNYNETYQQNPQPNPQLWAGINPQQFGQTYGQPFGVPGQAAYGQQFGQQPYGGQFFGQPNIGPMGQGWGQQRQLSQHDVSEVVRQLIPLLPQVLAQAQQPLAAIGYGAYGQTPRLLTQQDISEVVRQILPIVPQIAALSQGQSPWQTAAAYGGWQQPFGPMGSPQFQAAYGGPAAWGQPQRQLTPQDVNEVVRQLAAVIPQVMGNQAFNQPGTVH